jgi:hypothetical protein
MLSGKKKESENTNTATSALENTSMRTVSFTAVIFHQLPTIAKRGRTVK